MVAQKISDNDIVKETTTESKGGLNKQARMYLRRPVRSRVFESYVRDLHEMIQFWLAGDIDNGLLREALNEATKVINALDLNLDLHLHLQRAHIVLLDRVLRAVHELDDPADTGTEMTREQEEEIEKKMVSEIDREKHQKGTTERSAQSACAD